ncbi:hypothetical protein LTS18_014454, partial [Coniosporium uncinatum]
DYLSTDIDYFRRLSALTNVVPLISKSDGLTPPALYDLKRAILSALEPLPSRPFLFGRPIPSLLNILQSAGALPDPAQTPRPDNATDDPFLSTPPSPPTEQLAVPPYAVSSAPGPDTETMDASLLMSPDYVSPLLPSELHILVQQLFEPDNIAWLRHSAVKKSLAWRRSRLDVGLGPVGGGDGESMLMGTAIRARTPSSMGPISSLSMHSSTLSTPSPSQVLVPRFPHRNTNPTTDLSLSSLTTTTSSPYTLARLQDHQYREEQLAQLHLARWAQDLQTSLHNEKRRFERLVKDERARWLLERVGEEVRKGNIATTAAAAAAAGGNYDGDAADAAANTGGAVAGIEWARRDWAVAQHHHGHGTKGDKLERENVYASWATKGRYRSSSSSAVDSRDPL